MQRNLVNVLDVSMLLDALRTGFNAEQVVEFVWMVESSDRKTSQSVFSDVDGTDCDCPDGQADRSCMHACGAGHCHSPRSYPSPPCFWWDWVLRAPRGCL